MASGDSIEAIEVAEIQIPVSNAKEYIDVEENSFANQGKYFYLRVFLLSWHTYTFLGHLYNLDNITRYS